MRAARATLCASGPQLEGAPSWRHLRRRWRRRRRRYVPLDIAVVVVITSEKGRLLSRLETIIGLRVEMMMTIMMLAAIPSWRSSLATTVRAQIGLKTTGHILLYLRAGGGRSDKPTGQPTRQPARQPSRRR